MTLGEWEEEEERRKEFTPFRGEVGGRRGAEGGGFSGTTIKDTWTKPRGVEAAEGGGDGWGGGW